MRDDYRDAGIPNMNCSRSAGRRGIERNARAAGLEDGKEARHEVERSLHRDADANVRSDAERRGCRASAVSTRIISFAVGKLRVVEHDGHGVGGAPPRLRTGDGCTDRAEISDVWFQSSEGAIAAVVSIGSRPTSRRGSSKMPSSRRVNAPPSAPSSRRRSAGSRNFRSSALL
jgi:hypothetical protein